MTQETTHIPKLRFPEFEGAWEKVQLSSVTELIGGYAFSSNRMSSLSQIYQVVKMSNLYSGILDLGRNPSFIQTIEKNEAKYLLQHDDILISLTGTFGKRDFGFSVLIENPDNLLVNQRVGLMRVRTQFKASFVEYSTCCEYFQKRFHALAIGGTGNQANVSLVECGKIQLNFPELPEQQKIATFLTTVDQKIEKLQRKKDLLTDYKKGMMQKLFSQELRFKDDHGNNFPDWEEKKLGDILELTQRPEDKPSDHYLAIGVRSHMKGTFQKPNSNPDKISMDTLYVVRENDLIVNITFAWEGAIAMVPRKDDGGYVSHRFPTYRCRKNELIPSYLNHVIKDPKLKYILDCISPGGAGRNRVLSKADFLKIGWEFPNITEQQKIANYLTALDQKIELTNNKLTQAQFFKKGLLQQMFV